MPTVNLAGTPNVRYPDPRIKRVAPSGTQPYTSYSAVLAWNITNFVLSDPPEYLGAELLLFGADYVVQVAGTQTFTGYYDAPVYTGEIFDAAGDPIPFKDFSLPLSPLVGSASVDVIPTVLPNATPVSYKQIMTGKTATNGVEVSGFPHFLQVPSRNLWQTPSGQAGERANYLVVCDVLLNGAVVDGPSSFFPFGSASVHIPVILWEPDLTQKIKDDGYVIDLNGDGSAFFNVVGLWADQKYSPAGLMRSARSVGSVEAPALVTADSIRAALSPGAAAYADRVKRRK